MTINPNHRATISAKIPPELKRRMGDRFVNARQDGVIDGFRFLR